MRLNFHNSLTFFTLVIAAGMSYQSTANASVIERIDAQPTHPGLEPFNDELVLPQVSFGRGRGRAKIANLKKKHGNKAGNNQNN